MSSCWWLCWYCVIAHRKWWYVLCSSTDHGICWWLCCWARCCMSRDMDIMESSCVFHVKVGTFGQLEQCKICVLTVTTLGIVMLTIQHYLFSVSVPCNIPGITWDKHHQMSFRLKNFHWGSYKHEISAVTHLYVSQYTNKESWTNLLHLTEWLETPATSSYEQSDSSLVEHASWLLLILFRLEANYILLRTSHIISLSSSLPLPEQRNLARRTPPQGASRCESSRPTGAWSNPPPASTQ